MDFLIESPVVEVNAMTDKRHSKGEVEEMGTILLRYANGAMGIVTVSNVLPATGDYGRCFDVHGTKASLVGVGNLSRNPTGMLILQQENGISQRFTYGGHMATLWAGEVSEFSRCIIEDDVPRANGRHGMRNLQVLLAAYDSAFSEKIVKLDVEENTR
jgi:predicted dehydrogenase